MNASQLTYERYAISAVASSCCCIMVPHSRVCRRFTAEHLP